MESVITAVVLFYSMALICWILSKAWEAILGNGGKPK